MTVIIEEAQHQRPRTPARADAQCRLIDLHDDLEALLTGRGRWAGTPAGAAASGYDRAAATPDEARRATTECVNVSASSTIAPCRSAIV